AIYSGNGKALDYLIKKGGTYNQESIFKACRGNHQNTIDFFLKRNFDINTLGTAQGKTLLSEAARWGRINIVADLLGKGADPDILDTDGYTALGECIRAIPDGSPYQIDIAKILVKNGADINRTAPYKMTPLMLALDLKNQ
ncbi:MAG: ankyrin repeat domain-containing protein, partial [Candidatus Omnitrophica bacterium]|nr:ankyrin repeat domain-containing protein [Candidatus Omnitrophota bacterium]